MIRSKEDLKRYIKCDIVARYATERISIKERFYAMLVPTPWKYQFILRRAEYFNNCGSKLSRVVLGNAYRIKLNRYGAKCGYEIPLNSFGPGLVLVHKGTVVVNGNSHFGSNARIHVCVNIGVFSRLDEHWEENMGAPQFGDNVYIGPGAKIWGGVLIGDNVAIGANSIVTKSIESHKTVIGANLVLNDKGSIDMMYYGDAQCMPHDSYQYKTHV